MMMDLSRQKDEQNRSKTSGAVLFHLTVDEDVAMGLDVQKLAVSLLICF